MSKHPSVSPANEGVKGRALTTAVRKLRKHWSSRALARENRGSSLQARLEEASARKEEEERCLSDQPNWNQP